MILLNELIINNSKNTKFNVSELASSFVALALEGTPINRLTEEKNKILKIKDNKMNTTNETDLTTGFGNISSSIQERINKINTHNIGWKCPICGRGISPNINICPCVPLNKAFTYEEK